MIMSSHSTTVFHQPGSRHGTVVQRRPAPVVPTLAKWTRTLRNATTPAQTTAAPIAPRISRLTPDRAQLSVCNTALASMMAVAVSTTTVNTTRSVKRDRREVRRRRASSSAESSARHHRIRTIATSRLPPSDIWRRGLR